MPMEIADVTALLDKKISEIKTEYDGKLAESEKKLNSAQAQLRKLSEKPEPTIEPVVEIKTPVKKSAADIELDARIAKIEASAKRTAENSKKSEVVAHFTSIGLTGESLTDAVDLFLVRNSSKIQYDEDTGSVNFKALESGEPEPFGTWFKSANEAGKFKSLKPAKITPKKDVNGNSVNVGTTEKPEVSKSELMSGKVTRETLRQLAVAETE